MGMYVGGLFMFALGSKSKEITTIHSHGFVMALLQWHKVYKFSEDELQRPPVVALSYGQMDPNSVSRPYHIYSYLHTLYLSYKDVGPVVLTSDPHPRKGPI